MRVQGDGWPCIISKSSDQSITCTVTPWFATTNTVLQVIAGDQRSAGYPMTFDPPMLVGVTPSAVPTAGKVDIAVLGSVQSPAVVILVGSSTCQIQAFVDGGVSCTVPPGLGLNVPVRAMYAGVQGNAVPLNYLPPTVSQVSPPSGPTAGGFQLVITGDNLGTTGLVTLDGKPCPTVLWSDTQVTCLAPPGQGTVELRVAVGGQLAFGSFTYLAPTLDQVLGDAMPSGGTPLLLKGSNFGQTPLVRVGGSLCPVIDAGDQALVCSVPPGGGDRTITLRVRGQEALGSVKYGQPEPVSSAPSSGPSVGQTALTVTGTGFGPQPVVFVGDAGCGLVSGGDTSVVCLTPPGVGTVPIELSNGGPRVAAGTFTYTPPLLAQLSPSTGSGDGGVEVTLLGTSFGQAGIEVLVGEQLVLPSDSHHNLVRVVMPPGSGSVGVRLRRAGETSNELLFTYASPSGPGAGGGSAGGGSAVGGGSGNCSGGGLNA